MDFVGMGYSYVDMFYSLDYNGGMNINFSVVVYGGWLYFINLNQVGSGFGEFFINLNQVGSGYGGLYFMNLIGVMNFEGGVVIMDYYGNVYEGFCDDSEKKEGFVLKIMDKLYFL